ncbi:hypothetical protein SacmaDRAFT_5076 [Saccharomonospora marina XMU15]|uniref:Mg2+/Co2+ transporter n=1 Tax=Saccharomonospora marina XMU15 TaxID=882083 RepID=H5X345_9PSEU|nr:hypothetical protein [Saccharomonospora marina]EHR53244.1 hypothetical protein SacmaDRAFT_5076 [Saccharomonospora marina XMU15]
MSATVSIADGDWQHPPAPGEGEAFLQVPLLRVIGDPGGRRLLVGTLDVRVAEQHPVEIALRAKAVLAEPGGWHREDEALAADDSQLLAALADPPHEIAGDAATVAVTVAKGFAEASRNSVAELRGLRYELERQIADLLAERSAVTLRPLLAAIIELSMAIGRARDHARYAVREGLHIYLWDLPTYQLNRSAQAPGAGDAPWARTHRNAVRHCEAMEAELIEEAARLQALLGSMSTFAVAQESEAQQRFNLLAGLAAAGLGLPALILSLYGAEPFLPLDSFDRAWRALLPIALALMVALVFTLRRVPERVKPRHYVFAFTVVVALVLLLLVAGALAPAT